MYAVRCSDVAFSLQTCRQGTSACRYCRDTNGAFLLCATVSSDAANPTAGSPVSSPLLAGEIVTSPDAAAAIPSVASPGSSPVIAGEIASLVRSSHLLQHLAPYSSCIKLAEHSARFLGVALCTSIYDGTAYAATVLSDLQPQCCLAGALQTTPASNAATDAAGIVDGSLTAGQGQGLSKGAIAGIVLGSIAAATLLTTLIAFAVIKVWLLSYRHHAVPPMSEP